MGRIVRIHNTDRRATSLGVNLRVVNVPHNQDFPLAQAFVEALETSNVSGYTLGDEVPDEECAGYDPNEDSGFGAGAAGALRGSAADAAPITGPGVNQVPGGDNLQHHPAPPAAGVAVRTEGEKINQVPGGDNLTHAGDQSAQAQAGADEASRIRAAEDKAVTDAAAAREGLTPPAVIVNGPVDTDRLISSDTLPEILEAGGRRFAQHTIIRAAHAASGLSVDEFNALPAAERDSRLQTLVDDIEADPTRGDDLEQAPPVHATSAAGGDAGRVTAGDRIKAFVERYSEKDLRDLAAAIDKDRGEHDEAPLGVKGDHDKTEIATRIVGDLDGRDRARLSALQATFDALEPKEEEPEGETFDPAEILKGTIATITKALEGLPVEKLDALLAAEKGKGGQKRKGVASAVNEAKKALQAPETT